jgi:GDP-L-fucose synthase
MILVLGGNGFLGKNTVEKLTESDFTFISPTREELDLFDAASVTNFNMSMITGIINLAAKVGGIQFNIDEEATILSDNLRIALAVDDLARNAPNLNWIIQVGSTCMYPENTMLPYRISDIWNGLPVNETGQYGIAKRIQLMLTDSLPSHIKKLNVIPVNLYGKYDRFKGEHAHVIPALIKRIHLANKNEVKEVCVWGDPSVTREFLFASDLSDFFIQWMREPVNLTLNAGTGVETSMYDLSQVIAKTVGFKGSIVFDKDKPVGNRRRLVESKLYRDKYNKAPISLEEGIEMAYKDFLLNHV